MNIKVTSKNDRRAVRALIHLTFFGKGGPKRKLTKYAVIYGILNLFVIGSGFLINDFSIVPYVLLIDVIVVLFGAYGYFWLPSIQYKAQKKFADIENIFTFTDDYMCVASEIEGYSGEDKYAYSVLHGVKETSDYYVIYPDKTKAFVIDKLNFKDGNADVLKQKLMFVLGDKYTVCKY